MTLRTRIFSFNLISVLIATFVVAIVVLKIVESTVVETTYERLAQTRLNKTALVEDYFEDIQTGMGLIANHELTEYLLKNPSTAFPELRRLFDKYAIDLKIYDIFLLNAQGTILYSTRKDVPDGTSVVKDFTSESKIKNLYLWGSKASKGTMLFLDFSKDSFNPHISSGFYAAPIYNKLNAVGVLILKISNLEIDRIVGADYSWANDGLGTTGESLVFGADWILRSTSGFQLEKQKKNQTFTDMPLPTLGDEDLQKIVKRSEIREQGVDYRQQKVIRNIGQIHLPNGHKWYLETKIDENEAFAVLDRIIIASIAAGVLIFILFFFVTFAATGKVVEPIKLLTDRLEKLGTTNLTEKIKYNCRDEVGLLVDKYNQVATRLETTTVSKDFLDSVIQSINALLFVVKVNHNQDWQKCSYVITQANETAMKYLGLTKQQLRQTDLKDLIYAGPEFKNYHWLLQTQHGIEAEILSLNKEERIPILVNWAVLPQRPDENLTFVFVCTDIKDRIEVETALIEAREQAESASVAKSEFLARMSHEIRTPLNAIIGINDILAETELKPEQHQMIQVCKNAGENLLNLVNDILDIAKIEAGEIHLESIPFDLESTTKNLCEIFKPKALERNLKFGLNINMGSTENHIILADPSRLRQILFNLIGNAIKFTDKGEISVNLSFANRDKKDVLFLIKDTGVGIPVDKQSLVFQSFSQADSSITRKFGGSGLGLAISKNLVELMGGRIGFNSQPGKGSEFYFTIPFEQDENSKEPLVLAKETDKLSESGDLKLAKKPRILIVDDTEDNRFLLFTYLKNLPYEILEAENGQDALDKVFNDNIDVVLMDIQMPVMDGYEATKRIRKWENENHKQPIPIIAVSANAMSEDIQRSLSAGCTEHLTKPIKKNSLLDIIQKHTANFLQS